MMKNNIKLEFEDVLDNDIYSIYITIFIIIFGYYPYDFKNKFTITTKLF